MVWKHFDQCAGRNLVTDIIGRDLDKAQSGQAAGNVGLGTVDGDTSRDRAKTCLLMLDPLECFDPVRRW